ncbi:MAG: hypothetical protein K2N74_05285, partial [Clostridiales bacterium]|nr:hypothetical protein [Clostridiales bacterium]
KLSYYDFHGERKYDYKKNDVAIPADTTSQIRAFGTAKNEDGLQEVTTLTAGRLEKGMTISVKATAVTTYVDNHNNVDDGYYFPIIGFADRNLNGSGYEGGTSVIVRNEGWVLWDGIGTPRMLAALAGGAVRTKNYGTLPGDPSNGQEPAGYDIGRATPTDVNNWGMWHTYSKGTGSNSASYASPQDIELSWNYREDGVIELTYRNFTSLTTLTARTRVPDSSKGYYDTILHGEYVDYEFESVSTIMTRTLEDVFYHGAKESAKKAYLENEMLNLEDFDVKATYAQTGDVEQVVTTFDILATTKENATLDDATATWVSLSENPMSPAYKSFKVSLTSGVRTREKLIPANEFVTTVSNAISSIYGKDITEPESGVTFANNFRVGELGFTAFGEGNNIGAQINIVGGAQQLNADQIAVAAAKGINLDSTYRYIAICLYAEGHSTFKTTGTYTAKFEKNNEAAPVVIVTETDGSIAYLVIALNSQDAILIEGLQDTNIRLDFAGISGLEIGSKVTRNDLKLNKGGTVEIVYTFTEAHYNALVDANFLERSGVVVNGTVTRLNGNWTDNQATINGVKVTLDKTNFNATDRQLKVTYEVPAFSAKNVGGFEFALQTGTSAGDMANRVTDTVYYDMEFATGDAEVAAISNKLFVEADGTKLYIAQAFSAEDLTSQILQGTLKLNINNGVLEDLNLTNLSWTFAKGALVFENKQLPEDLATYKLYQFGTLDNDKDTDWGAVLVIEVDTTKLGVENSPFLFELNADATKAPTFYYKAENTTVSKVTDGVAAATRLTLSDGDCFHEGLTAYAVKDNENNVVFYAGLNAFAGNHNVESGVCTLCGAIVEEKSGTLVWYGWAYENAINEGDQLEFQGTYKSVGGNWDGLVAAVLFENTKSGNKAVGIVNSNASGYIEYAHAAEGSNNIWEVRDAPYSTVEGFENGNQKIQSSLITEEHPYNSISGWLDPAGEGISKESLQEAAEGGTFRVIVKHEGDKITINYRLYKKDIPLSGEAFYSFTYTVTTDAANKYTLAIGGMDDKGTLKDNAWTIIKGTKVNSVLDSAAGITEGEYTSGNLTFGAPVMENGYAVISASGAASKLTSGQTIGDNTHYAAFRLNFTLALPATSTFTLKNADGNAVAGSTVELTSNRKGINVLIPIKEAAGVYTIEMSNSEGFTAQCSIKVDLASIMVSDTVATISENTLNLAGGSFKVNVDGTALTGTMQLQVNGSDKVALSDIVEGTTTLGGLKITDVSIENGFIVFEQTALDFTKALGLYTITLFNGANTVASTSANCVKLPTNDSVLEDAYVVANGNKLTFVFTDGVNKNATKAFKLNANKGGSDYALLANYDLTFKVSGTGAVSFNEKNALTRSIKGVYSQVSDKHVVAVTVDLTALGIGASEAYGFEAFIGASTTSLLRTVDASRSLTAVTASGEAAVIVTANCSQNGLKAKGTAFYYALETTPMTNAHTWGTAAANGLKECSVCHAWRKTGDSKNTEITAAQLTGVAANGLTISFQGKGDSGNDWVIRTLATKLGNLIVMYPNIGGAGASVAGGAVVKVTTDLPETCPDTNIFTQAEYDEIVAKFEKIVASAFPEGDDFHNGAIWNTLHNTEGYVSIVLDPVNGVSFYLDGELKVHFDASRALSNGKVRDFVGAFLGLAELGGIDFAASGHHAKANDLYVVKHAMTAQEVVAAKAQYAAELAAHTHHYDSTTDRCPDDNALNPNHGDTSQGGLAHNYDATHHCTICGELNPAHTTHSYTNNGACACGVRCEHPGATIENGCSACGATWQTTTLTENNTFSDTAFVTRKWSIPVDLHKGEKIVVTGTNTSTLPNAWNAVCFEFDEGYTGRTDAYGWTFADAAIGGADVPRTASIKLADGTDVSNNGDPFWAQFKEKFAGTVDFTIEFSWTTDESVSVTLTFENADHDVYTCAYTLPRVDQTITAYHNIHLGVDTNSITVNSWSAYGWTPAAE